MSEECHSCQTPSVGSRSNGAVMVISRRVARFNAHVTNRLTRRIAGWMPGFAIVSHLGRRTGRTYRTPVNLFRDGDRYVVALTYGTDSEWVRNVIAAGGCTLQTRRKTFDVGEPKLFGDPSRKVVPMPARWILGRFDVSDFLSLADSSAPGEGDVREDVPDLGGPRRRRLGRLVGPGQVPSGVE